MANPNKTVASFRRKFGRSQSAVDATRTRMDTDSPVKRVMEAVSRGEVTAEEGARRVAEIMNGEK